MASNNSCLFHSKCTRSHLQYLKNLLEATSPSAKRFSFRKLFCSCSSELPIPLPVEVPAPVAASEDDQEFFDWLVTAITIPKERAYVLSCVFLKNGFHTIWQNIFAPQKPESLQQTTATTPPVFQKQFPCVLTPAEKCLLISRRGTTIKRLSTQHHVYIHINPGPGDQSKMANKLGAVSVDVRGYGSASLPKQENQVQAAFSALQKEILSVRAKQHLLLSKFVERRNKKALQHQAATLTAVIPRTTSSTMSAKAVNTECYIHAHVGSEKHVRQHCINTQRKCFRIDRSLECARCLFYLPPRPPKLHGHHKEKGPHGHLSEAEESSDQERAEHAEQPNLLAAPTVVPKCRFHPGYMENKHWTCCLGPLSSAGAHTDGCMTGSQHQWRSILGKQAALTTCVRKTKGRNSKRRSLVAGDDIVLSIF